MAASAVTPVTATNGGSAANNSSGSPGGAVTPRNVAFELLFPESPQYRARLPLRVSIFPHDTTDSIVTTVKNFYGLYSGPTVSKGVSFEDEQGNTLIARYENFRNNMIVYVRVFEEPPPAVGAFGPQPYQGPTAPAAPAAPHYAGDNYPLQAAQQQQAGQHISRPTSRTSRKRSISPTGGVRDRRSVSAGTNSVAGKKSRPWPPKSRGPGSQANGDAQSDSYNGYSSGDGAPGSASGKIKDHLGNTEISVDNIVEGGRRKRAKFESSELPLFAPPQMPAATSNPSVSPARRVEHPRHSHPFVTPSQNPFTNPRPLQSPQTYNHNGFARSGLYAAPAADFGRARGNIGYAAGVAVGQGLGILPTPDPTVGSCMSEEDKDVAMQLMRLGEMSNVSHGRTSASTLDDTFSGKADAASSTGATSEGDSESEADMPPARKQRLDAAGHSRKIFQTTEGHFLVGGEDGETSGDEADSEDGAVDGSMAAPKMKKPQADGQLMAKPKLPKLAKVNKVSRPNGPKIKKPASVPGPMSPASLPASRKPSIVSTGTLSGLLGDDEPDLSTKPRCQRCRKSKKGCDRQRPCGRCRDAGLPAELCISEDEGNGRKGRYGRHMGVPIKKEEMLLPPPPPALLPAAPIAPAFDLMDKNKKRKR